MQYVPTAIGFLIIATLFLSGCAGGISRNRTTIELLDPASETQSLDKEQTKILSIAKALLGTPYRFGGTTPNEGFDCSGYVAYVFQQAVGLPLPRRAKEQIEIGKAVSSSLQPADIVYFKISGPNSWHIGIYIGKGKFIHAPSARGVVNIQDINLPYWKERFSGARRL